MAGHSKWAQIKHKKAVTDARRGAEFTKLARAIQVAGRDGGGDPAGNASLANAIQKAKDAGMPKQNIERAIAKGTGADTDAAAIETVVYEGYGPGGVAILVEALTDNRNRTGSEIRHIFSRTGGNLGEPGSVAWQFEKKGIVVVDADRASEDDLMVAIDAGAEDVGQDENVYEVVTAPGFEISSPTTGPRRWRSRTSSSAGTRAPRSRWARPAAPPFCPPGWPGSPATRTRRKP